MEHQNLRRKMLAKKWSTKRAEQAKTEITRRQADIKARAEDNL